MDKYAANWSVLIIAIIECILIAWLYGSERFLADIQSMIGPRSRAWVLFWSIMWRYVTPAALFFILFFNWVEYKPASYGSYVYPLWADAVGWFVGLFPVAVIILTAIQEVVCGPANLTVMQRIRFLMRPTCEWGPAGRTVTFTTGSSATPQRYDSVANTMVLLNGMPMDDNGDAMTMRAQSKDSRITMVVVNGHSSNDDEEDEGLQLWERVLVPSSSSSGEGNNSGNKSLPGILKNNRSTQSDKQQRSEVNKSPTKQPLLKEENSNIRDDQLVRGGASNSKCKVTEPSAPTKR